MRVAPYRYTPAKPRPRLGIAFSKVGMPSYIASFDRLNNLKSGVAYIIGGTRYPNV